MLDLDLLRTEKEAVETALLKRMDEVDLDTIIELDKRRRALMGDLDRVRGERKRIARQGGAARAKGQGLGEEAVRAVEIKQRVSDLEHDLDRTREALEALMADLPNLPDERVPPGGKENNQVVKLSGERPERPDWALDHVALGSKLGLVDFERGVKLGGRGFWLYSGQGAALEWALLDYFCQAHYRDGYQFFLPPHILTTECGYATGQFPKFHEDVYHLKSGETGHEHFLLPTAETALLNIYRDEILSLADLPLKAFAYTPCYRREGGGPRADERGTVRGHQFNKVEMFQFVAPEQAEQALQELLRRAESLLDDLGLHYRTVLLAARDASASMRLTYDVEVWIPSINGYKEVTSVSWAGDYQARRAKIRYRPDGEKGTRLVHTLNASGLATSRLFPAILEQHQDRDGSIAIPEPLRAWMHTDRIVV